MSIKIGNLTEFILEEYDSRFITHSLKCFFNEDLANLYQPMILAGDYFEPQPEGIYYRVISAEDQKAICIQYYVYWLEQDCLGALPIADHKYDYEPIFVYLEPPKEFPIGIVNAGYSKALGMSCRFHKTEVRMKDYNERDISEAQVEYRTSPGPFYPFGGSDGLQGATCVKKYPLAGAMYMNELRPLFGIVSCSHVFSGSEKDLRGEILSIPLKRLDDLVLNDWYFQHHMDPDEEPFGHDVSNPFDFPYIKYHDPKPILRTGMQ
jgi:hypothetical protein